MGGGGSTGCAYGERLACGLRRCSREAPPGGIRVNASWRRTPAGCALAASENAGLSVRAPHAREGGRDGGKAQQSADAAAGSASSGRLFVFSATPPCVNGASASGDPASFFPPAVSMLCRSRPSPGAGISRMFCPTFSGVGRLSSLSGGEGAGSPPRHRWQGLGRIRQLPPTSASEREGIGFAFYRKAGIEAVVEDFHLSFRIHPFRQGDFCFFPEFHRPFVGIQFSRRRRSILRPVEEVEFRPIFHSLVEGEGKGEVADFLMGGCVGLRPGGRVHGRDRSGVHAGGMEKLFFFTFFSGGGRQ